MRKIFIVVLLLGFIAGCASTPSTSEVNKKKLAALTAKNIGGFSAKDVKVSEIDVKRDWKKWWSGFPALFVWEASTPKGKYQCMTVQGYKMKVGSTSSSCRKNFFQ